MPCRHNGDTLLDALPPPGIAGGMRPLSEIRDDIADVRANLKKARAATSYGFGGRNLTRSYAELRQELRDLLDEERAALAAARGPFTTYTTVRRH